jgi:serine/threonine-protein kinase
VVALVAAILWAAAGPGPVSLPDLKGAPVATAEARLGALGLKAGIRTADRAATSAGTVLDQHPVAGSRVPAGSTVALTVASGFVDLTATSLVGEAASTAEATVTARGLRFTTSSVVSTATPGTVVSVSPSGRLPLGSSVTVGVAVAPPVPTTTTTAPGAPPPGPGGKQPGGPGKGH